MGPYKLITQTGEHSYIVNWAPHKDQEVHLDQIKKCSSIPEIERAYPVVYRRGEPLVSLPEANIQKILQVQITENNVRLQVEWTEGVGGGDKVGWKPIS